MRDNGAQLGVSHDARVALLGGDAPHLLGAGDVLAEEPEFPAFHFDDDSDAPAAGSGGGAGAAEPVVAAAAHTAGEGGGSATAAVAGEGGQTAAVAGEGPQTAPVAGESGCSATAGAHVDVRAALAAGAAVALDALDSAIRERLDSASRFAWRRERCTRRPHAQLLSAAD